MTNKLMFPEVTRTWNPIVGCEHGCSYCYARHLAHTRLRHLANDFAPTLVARCLQQRFNRGFIFVSSMGDMWGDWVPDDWILSVLEIVRESPKATFLFLTKNPARYAEFWAHIPSNVVLGATIEGNASTNGQAPAVTQRLVEMARLRGMAPGRHLMISIEPIMEFNLDSFVEQIRVIEPAFVYVGYDNHPNLHAHLYEPPLAKTQELIRHLSAFTVVRVKTLREAME